MQHSYSAPAPDPPYNIYNRWSVSNARESPLPPFPPRANPPLPPRAASPLSVNDAPAQFYISQMLAALEDGFPHFPVPSSDAVCALAALSYLYLPHADLHRVFWSVEQRRKTAAVVQRVLDSSMPLISAPVNWTGATSMLAMLAAWDAHAVAAAARAAKRKRSGAKKAAEPQKAQRVTRAAARQRVEATDAETSTSTPSATSSATPAPEVAAERKRRPSPLAPPRTCARQQQKREVSVATSAARIPPAVAASVSTALQPSHSRARSTSHESSETLVAASRSRSASVLSAATIVVDVFSADGSDKKGKGRQIVPMVADENLKPHASGVVTRSRAKAAEPAPAKAAAMKACAKAAPYPATKDEQIVAGRGQGRTVKAPTGKRKTAKK